MAPLSDSGFETPLESARFQTLSCAAAVTAFLDRLAERCARMTCFEAGRSRAGRPITAVLLSSDPAFLRTRRAAARVPTAFLVGALHGDEASGCEALLRLVRDIAQGRLPRLAARANLVCVPLANPDGRDMNRRGNAADVNLNMDFLLQSQPETMVLTRLLREFRPEALLDAHETPAFKKGLAAAGYLSGFEAQVAVANNPNIDRGLLDFSETVLLPRLLQRINDKGLNAMRYYGEVSRLDKPATHGGLSLRNFRNYAALAGAVPVLLENRLDPPDGDYPTPANIRDRTERQYLSITGFLEEVARLGETIAAVAGRARERAAHAAPGEEIVLAAEFVADESHPTVDLPLRPIGGGPVMFRPFPYRPRVSPTLSVRQPAAYCITAQHGVFARLLRRHALDHRPVTEHAEVSATVVQRPDRAETPVGREGEIAQLSKRIRLRPGDLIVETRQPGAVLLPLLFDARSPHCVFRTRPYSEILDRETGPLVSALERLPENLARR